MKVLLLSNKLYHYRVEVYNYFRSEFLKDDFQFEVLVDEVQESIGQVQFPLHILERTYPAYRKKIDEIGPDIVIFFLHLKDTSIFPLYWHCRRKNIRTIFWGHGINLWTPESKMKRLFYNYLHKRSDAIVLYAPDQRKYIKPVYHSKTYIALNTINFHSFPTINKGKEELRKQYGLKYKSIVLFCGRVTADKQLDILIDIFLQSEDKSTGLLIVGGGLSDEMRAVVEKQENIIYYGAVYEPVKVNELHKLSDLFCIPGKCGLSINQAMYWNLPVLTTDVIHAPEIYYLKDGVNGFIASDKNELAEKIALLAGNPQLLREFSSNAKRIIMEEADISNMTSGFLQAFRSVVR
jgi:glycosyltransferase involved in cell wall biosynthesis